MIELHNIACDAEKRQYQRSDGIITQEKVNTILIWINTTK
jgi:hypothetical protein